MAPLLLRRAFMRTNRRRRSAGFTLIELLVVVSTIGVLAAIAIPQFRGRQGKAFDARILMDAKNAALAEESYFDTNGSYYAGSCDAMPGMRISPGVNCQATEGGVSFEVVTTHVSATKTCRWNSAVVPSLSCS